MDKLKTFIRWFFLGKKPFKEELKSFAVMLGVFMVIRTFLFQPFIIPSGSMKPNLYIGDLIFVSKYTFGFTKHTFPFSLPLLSKRVLEFNKPKIGDVVVFKGPYDPDIDYIKRVVGLPGDKIKMQDGILYVNNVAAEVLAKDIFIDDLWIKREKNKETRIKDEKLYRKIKSYEETLPNGVKHMMLKKYDFGSNGTFDNSQTYTVPEGHYFMMGDNRDESGDSRVQYQIGYVPADHIVGKAQVIFFSTKARWWQFWRWLTDIRYSRIFKKIA